jgi:aminoglycoside phosphotransferase (APT) family kinase protein
VSTAPDPLPFAQALGFGDAAEFEAITGGWDNHLWRFRTGDGRHLVLRVFRTGGDSEGTVAAAQNEGLAMRAAREAGVAVPEVLAEGVLDGTPAAVHAWMRGETAGETLKRNPWKARRIGRAMGR